MSSACWTHLSCTVGETFSFCSSLNKIGDCRQHATFQRVVSFPLLSVTAVWMCQWFSLHPFVCSDSLFPSPTLLTILFFVSVAVEEEDDVGLGSRRAETELPSSSSACPLCPWTSVSSAGTSLSISVFSRVCECISDVGFCRPKVRSFT